MTDEERKKWIDGASYSELLSKWRYAPAGDPFFRGEVGGYYQEQMTKKKAEVGDEEAVRISKSLS